MRKAKQSTAKNVMILMVDSTDHVTGKAGLTLTITASKDGAAFASISPTVTERGNGWYNIALTSSHTDTLGDLALHITGTAADPADIVLLVEAGATDADVSTRLATAGYTAPDNATIATIQSDTNDIQTRLPAALVSGRIDASVGAMAADVVTATAIAAGAITSTEAPALANLDAAVSTRLATAGYTAPDNASISAILTDTAEIGAAGAGLTVLATAANLAVVAGYLDTEIAAIKAKTDNLPADPADQSAVEAAITAATSPLATAAALATVDTVVDSILVDTAEIGVAGAGLTALATQASVNTIDDFLDTEVAAIKAQTDLIPAAPAAVGDIPTAAVVADAVWDEALAGHLGAGSTGSALNGAGAAGDPWGTALPGAYAAGTAGKIVGDALDAAVSSRLATAGYTAPDNATITAIAADTAAILVDTAEIGVAGAGLTALATQASVNTIDDFLDTEVAAIKAKTDLIPAAPAAVGDIPTAAENATAVWDEVL